MLTQNFEFGIDLIIKDISKLCSLKIDEVIFFLREIDLRSILLSDKESYLDRSFFSSSPYRKIKHQLILDIISARLDEIVEICYEKNINLNYFKKNNSTIYIIIEKLEFFKNFQFSLKKNKLINSEFIFGKNIRESLFLSLNGGAELIGKGWEKEAIPVIQSNRSIISNFFSRLFS